MVNLESETELIKSTQEPTILVRDWSSYYESVSNRPPRKTLLQALDTFEKEASILPRFAVDLGCGDGRDTVELLRRGWRVLAIDGEAEALDRLIQRPNLNLTNLETQKIRFEDLQLVAPISLINASFSLPFCPPYAFLLLWQTLVTALSPSGRFCGQLFGERDSWATHPALTHHTRSQIEALLQPFEIELLSEEEEDGETPLKEPRHWHIFQIIARKRF